ncbi:sensor histidine kinase [Salinarimonas soli]|uniref:histidine kinase n=1 Tax=Salinarimonas soli TaxID=1638099 RepID=A0A5B2VG98_9HYPH|nr:sensor histidine kinase [Salinarimonas soli]KAA2237576.1 HAMP domain-containing protein [Salinarimonas soli]
MVAGRRPSLRLVFAMTIAVIGLVATAALAILASRETSERLRRDIGADLAELATHMADNLDRGMYERWRDIQVAAALDGVRDSSPGVRSAAIERLRATYPDYAAILFVPPDGVVQAATIPKVVGADVGKRDYFVEGSKAPFVGDVHDAILLANLLANDPRDPPRFVDLAAPVQAADGSFAGVLAAHLYWSWAEDLERALRRAAHVRHPEIDVFVLARDGTVLLGPRELLKTVPTARSARSAAAGTGGSAVETWADGRTYLSGYTRTSGYRDYPGLGWSVLVRQDADLAFAAVGQMQRRIAIWGALVALLTAVLAWFAAEIVVRPLRTLAGSAAALGRGEPIAVPEGATSEVGQVADALAAAARELDAKERRQQLLIKELNHRVKNTLATVQAMAMLTGRSAPTQEAYRENLEARIMALSKTHNLLTAAAWETVSLHDLLRTELDPYDDRSGRRIVLDGPSVPLSPRVAVPMGLAAHELATNAAKYGALSVPEGCIRVSWRVSDDEAGPRLHLVWKETGGPRVTPPARKGFGSRLLQQGIARDLDGETHLDFAPEGLACRMLVSLGEAQTKPVLPLEPRRGRPAIAAL